MPIGAQFRVSKERLAKLRRRLTSMLDTDIRKILKDGIQKHQKYQLTMRNSLDAGKLLADNQWRAFCAFAR